MFQAGIIKLCCQRQENTKEEKQFISTNGTIGENKNLEERVQKIEQYLKSMKTTNISSQDNSLPNTAVRVTTTSVSPANQVNTSNHNTKASTATKKFSNKVEEYWPQIVNQLKQSGKIVLYTNLMHTHAVELNDMTVGIQFPNGLTSFGKTVLEKQENVREISNLVSIACGKEMHIKYMADVQPKVQKAQEEDIQNLAKESGIPFQVID